MDMVCEFCQAKRFSKTFFVWNFKKLTNADYKLAFSAIAPNDDHDRRYNAPISSEVGICIVNTHQIGRRNIVIKKRITS